MNAQEKWSAADHCIEEWLHPADPVLAAFAHTNATAGLPPIDVSAPQGKFLHLLAQTQGARSILEIGTLGGFSTTWLARALPADGRLITLELDPKHARVARENLRTAGVAEKVEVIEGPAAESLARPGAVIIADNVVRQAQIADPASPDANVQAARAFIKKVGAEPRLNATVLQTVGKKGHDGFLFARVLT